MSPSQAQRFAPLSGVVFFVLALISALVLYPSGAPDFAGDPAEIAAFYTENESDLLPAGIVYLVSGVFLMWFVGTLRTHLREAEGGTGRIAGIAFGGGVAAATLLWAGSAIDMLGALRVGEQDAIDPQVATVYWDLSTGLFGLAAPYGMAVLLGASAVAALRFGALPSWLAWTAVLIAVACVVAPIAFAAIIVSFLWVAITGVVLYMGETPARA